MYYDPEWVWDPWVSQNPYLYPLKPAPVAVGTGFIGYRCGLPKKTQGCPWQSLHVIDVVVMSEVCGRMWGDVALLDAESGGGGKQRDVATSHWDGGVCGVGCKWGGMALLPRRRIEISGPNKNFSVIYIKIKTYQQLKMCRVSSPATVAAVPAVIAISMC